MSGTQYLFGFWEGHTTLTNDHFSIESLPESPQIVEQTFACPQADRGWMEPPIVGLPGKPEIPQGRFQLRSTHVLTTRLRSQDAALGEFLVLALGFTVGLRLTIEGAGHLQRAAIKEGTLVNFRASDEEILHVLGKACTFWHSHSAPEIRRLVFGAIHWYLTSQSYHAQHEEFAWTYSVLDSLHKLAKETSSSYAALPTGKHGQRPVALAQTFNIPLPSSFAGSGADAHPTSALVECRNTLIHEARWAEAPIGYGVNEHNHDMIQDLQHFCSQLILRLLGVECGFCGTVYDRQMHRLDVVLPQYVLPQYVLPQ